MNWLILAIVAELGIVGYLIFKITRDEEKNKNKKDIFAKLADSIF